MPSERDSRASGRDPRRTGDPGEGDREFGTRFVSWITGRAIDRPRTALVIAVCVALVSVVAAASLEHALQTDRTDYDDPSSSSVSARDTFTDTVGHAPEPAVLALLEGERGGRESRLVARLIGADPAIERVEVKARPGEDAALVVGYVGAESPREEQEAFLRIRDNVHNSSNAKLGGVVAFNEDANEISSLDVLKVEMVALPLLFLVLILALRSARLAATTIAIGVLAMLASMLCLRVAASLLEVSVFALNLQVALALGLLIDYGLLTITRVREERLLDDDPLRALRKAVVPVGRTIVASGLVLIAAMATLGIFPMRFLYSMGLAGIFAVLCSCAVSVYVLPAVLALKPHWLGGREGRKIASAALDGSNQWFRLGRWVRRRPIPVATACIVLLAVLFIPFTNLKFIGVDETQLPTSAESRQVADQLREQMPESRAETMFATLSPELPRPRLVALAARVDRLDGVRAVRPIAADGATALAIQTNLEPLTEPAQRLTGEARAVLATESGELGGPTPSFVDQRASIESHLPLLLVLLFGGSLVLVGLVTRSLLLPVKTFLLNLLTLGATLGVLVLVFQYGNLESLLGYEGQGAIDLTQPILVSVITFGLMTDYSIFLLTRIRECYLGGASNAEAVVAGLGHTGRVISWAAVGVCTAIGALVVSDIVFIKQLGLGTAFAVALDATVVRCLLLPASMILFGKWNWWLPLGAPSGRSAALPENAS